METVFQYIHTELIDAADPAYLKFQGSLIPGDRPAKMLGVRTPFLRALAKKVLAHDDCGDFLEALPHEYFEENQLHAFIISEKKDISECINLIDAFLPYVDNWATCDQMTPRSFKKDKPLVSRKIDQWINSPHVYTKRFGIKTAMSEFLDKDFDPAFLEKIANVTINDYYVMMMVAWYFATALAKQYPAAIKYIESRRLDPETHRKTIQKACESYRLTDDQKAYLRTLK